MLNYKTVRYSIARVLITPFSKKLLNIIIMSNTRRVKVEKKNLYLQNISLFSRIRAI